MTARSLWLWFESRLGARMPVCCEYSVLSGSGLCVRLITRPEESHRVVCLSVIINPRQWGGHWRRCAMVKKNTSTSDHRASVAGLWIGRNRSWPTPDNSRVSFWRDREIPWRTAVARTGFGPKFEPSVYWVKDQTVTTSLTCSLLGSWHVLQEPQELITHNCVLFCVTVT